MYSTCTRVLAHVHVQINDTVMKLKLPLFPPGGVRRVQSSITLSFAPHNCHIIPVVDRNVHDLRFIWRHWKHSTATNTHDVTSESTRLYPSGVTWADRKKRRWRKKAKLTPNQHVLNIHPFHDAVRDDSAVDVDVSLADVTRQQTCRRRI